MALPALSCVAEFLVGEASSESLLVVEEERRYSRHRAFVLSTYVDSLFARCGEINLDMRDVESLFLNMDAMKTPLADAWHHAGLHRIVYRYADHDLCPLMSSWFDKMRYGDRVIRRSALLSAFRCNLCHRFADIEFRFIREPDKTLHHLRNLGV
jgi:hypothetical protein